MCTCFVHTYNTSTYSSRTTPETGSKPAAIPRAFTQPTNHIIRQRQAFETHVRKPCLAARLIIIIEPTLIPIQRMRLDRFDKHKKPCQTQEISPTLNLKGTYRREGTASKRRIAGIWLGPREPRSPPHAKLDRIEYVYLIYRCTPGVPLSAEYAELAQGC